MQIPPVRAATLARWQTGIGERTVLKDLGIRGRVLVLTLLPSTLLAVVLGAYFTWMQLSEMRHQLDERGQLIAAIGSSGRSTGPHLHYVVEVGGKPRNPLDYIFD